jgi:hypothetical protein
VRRRIRTEVRIPRRWLVLFLQPQPRETAAKHELRKGAVKVERAATLGGLWTTHNYVMTSRAVKGWALMNVTPENGFTLGANADCNQGIRNCGVSRLPTGQQSLRRRAVPRVVMSLLFQGRMSLKVKARCAPCRILKPPPKTTLGEQNWKTIFWRDLCENSLVGQQLMMEISLEHA